MTSGGGLSRFARRSGEPPLSKQSEGQEPGAPDTGLPVDNGAADKTDASFHGFDSFGGLALPTGDEVAFNNVNSFGGSHDLDRPVEDSAIGNANFEDLTGLTIATSESLSEGLEPASDSTLENYRKKTSDAPVDEHQVQTTTAESKTSIALSTAAPSGIDSQKTGDERNINNHNTAGKENDSNFSSSVQANPTPRTSPTAQVEQSSLHQNQSEKDKSCDATNGSVATSHSAPSQGSAPVLFARMRQKMIEREQNNQGGVLSVNQERRGDNIRRSSLTCDALVQGRTYAAFVDKQNGPSLPVNSNPTPLTPAAPEGNGKPFDRQEPATDHHASSVADAQSRTFEAENTTPKVAPKSAVSHTPATSNRLKTHPQPSEKAKTDPNVPPGLALVEGHAANGRADQNVLDAGVFTPRSGQTTKAGAPTFAKSQSTVVTPDVATLREGPRPSFNGRMDAQNKLVPASDSRIPPETPRMHSKTVDTVNVQASDPKLSEFSPSRDGGSMQDAVKDSGVSQHSVEPVEVDKDDETVSREESFDDLLTSFLTDLRDATDLMDQGEEEVLELDVELSHAYSMALRYRSELMELQEAIDKVMNAVKNATGNVETDP